MVTSKDLFEPYGNGKKNRAEYSAWLNMRRRCNDATHPAYKHYGGRGITVCDRWEKSFSAFLDDVGKRPSAQHSLDRFPDNNAGYEPGNVRWGTRHEQAANRRKPRKYFQQRTLEKMAKRVVREEIQEKTA